MPLLLNYTHPFLSIYIPATGAFRQFESGKLVIEEDDPDYAVVMAEAVRNPNITVYEQVGTCPFCGEVVGKGRTAEASVAAHVNAQHPDRGDGDEVAVLNREVKSRAEFFCDVCRPTQTFLSEEDQRIHVATIHAARPTLDAEGNTVEGEAPTRRRRPGEAGIPAAKRR